MTVQVNGTTGVSLIQDGTVSSSAKIAAGVVEQGDLDTVNKSLQVKAWCNFNGATAGTNAPRAGVGVTSITKNAAGDYTINFTGTPFADVDYIMFGSIASNVSSSSTHAVIKSATQLGSPTNKTTTVCQVLLVNYAGGVTDNLTEIYLAFMGN